MNLNKTILLAVAAGVLLGVLATVWWYAAAGMYGVGGPWSMMGRWGGSGSPAAGGNAVVEPARHFIEMMIPHHDEAIRMAELARTGAKHAEIKQLVEDIIRTQTDENERMRAWYREWFGTDVPDYGMVRGFGMEMRFKSGPALTMGVTGEELAAAEDFDRAFLELMIPHHQMGVMMAQMVLMRSDRMEIRELARDIVNAQNREIEQMRGWYRAWYGQ